MNHLCSAGRTRRAAPALAAVGIAVALLVGCSSSDEPASPTTTAGTTESGNDSGTQAAGTANADLDAKLERRSRFVLASGGIAPVIDATGPNERHSVFANAFLEVLQNSSGTMSVVELYGRVFDRMYAKLAQMGLTQEPELRVIRAAGHQSEGDFFFVRQ